MVKKSNDPRAAAENDIERVGTLLWGPSWQSVLADAIGVSRDTIQDWKNGRMTPRLGVYSDLLTAALQRQRDIAAAVAILETRVRQSQALRALARKTDDDEGMKP